MSTPPTLSRRRLLGSLALSPLAASAAGPRPNVLFLAVDDLRPELGCYGRKYIQSPNIDRLASRGVTFERAYVQQAVCSPSRSSLLTGTRPDSTKVWDLVTHFRAALPDVSTIPQHFKNNGYFTQGIGKIYHPGYDDAPSWSTPWQTPKSPNYARGPGSVNSDEDAVPANGKKKDGPAFESADVPDDFYKDGKVANLAVEALRARRSQKDPFFLAVGFAKPHLPFVSPKRYWDLYDPAKIELAPNPFAPKDAAPQALPSGPGELRQYTNIPNEGPIPDALARQLKHGYYASISYTDAQIGKVLSELDSQGLTQNTIIVLWGDHGWKLGEHGAWAKHTNFENDTNAPLIFSAPGLKTAGKHSRALVEFVDIFPTLSELAGLPLPKHLEGQSLAPLLANPARPGKAAAFSQYPRGQRSMGYSMRTDRYRLTVWLNRKDHSVVDAIELYDHQTDPLENANIAKTPGNEPLVAKLMEQWQKGWRGSGLAN